MNFKYSVDNKRYHTLNYYNRQKYGRKVYKAAVNAGLTCPNIDGTLGTGGCIYCESGSAYFTNKNLSVSEQISAEINRINKNGGENRFIAYFQSNTNTYTDVETLKNMIETAFNFDEIVGVTLSTRTDCIDDKKLELLLKLSEKKEISLEFGLQTVHNETLELINRCQTFESFLKGYEKVKASGLQSCIHIINGLPYETEEMMLETAKEVGKLSPKGIKIHMLHISKGTALAKMYDKKPFDLLSRDEYINIIVKQLELIPPATVIERLTGDGDKTKLIAPLWTADKIAVLGGIDKKMAELDTFQGKKLETVIKK
ncbi:MAG: TIGR01212 family radical SAM protein [Acutalibacteraceae bacterium]